jgi:hypothetical protein
MIRLARVVYTSTAFTFDSSTPATMTHILMESVQ